VLALLKTRFFTNRMTNITEETARPSSVSEYDDRNGYEWMISFAAVMVPFCGFLYGHKKGMTVRVMDAVVKSPVGVYGLLALPLGTLAMEKCIYDTVQSAQGINPNVRPKDRGGFPSGGAELPSFSLIPVQKTSLLSFARNPR
jgi:hypothetical protein